MLIARGLREPLPDALPAPAEPAAALQETISAGLFAQEREVVFAD